MKCTPCPAPDPDLPLPLQQQPAYGTALGRSTRPIMVEDAGGPLAYALCLSGPLGGQTVLRGPIWLRKGSVEARVRALRIINARMIEAEDPDPALSAAGFAALVTPAHVAEWDLRPCDRLRRDGMLGKWRNALRQAEDGDLHTEQARFSGDLAHPLFALSRNHARARRYAPLPAAVTCRLAQGTPGALRLFTAHHRGAPLAYMLFARFGPVVTYHIGWTGAEGRARNAHHLLLDQAARYFARRGCIRMDLGHVDTQAAPGLARFKIGTGATVRPLGGSHMRLWPRVLVSAARAG